MATNTKTKTEAEKLAISRKAKRTRTANIAKAEAHKKALARKRAGNLKNKGFMGDIFTPAAVKGGLGVVRDGVVAGAIAFGVDMIFAGSHPVKKVGMTALTGFVSAVAFGKPQVGTGLVAVAARDLLAGLRAGITLPLNEGPTYLMDNHYVDNIEALPMVLDTEGNPMSDEHGNGYDAAYFPAYN